MEISQQIIQERSQRGKSKILFKKCSGVKKQKTWPVVFSPEITSFDQQKRDEVIIDDICHLSNQEQPEIIADKFASIQNEYEALQTDDIVVPPFTQKQIPKFQPSQVWLLL